MDASGAPVPNAIILWPYGRSQVIKQLNDFRNQVNAGDIENAVLSDNDGKFSLTIEKRAERMVVFVFAEGFAPTSFTPNPTTANYKVVLDEGVTWRGTVLSATRKPLEESNHTRRLLEYSRIIRKCSHMVYRGTNK